MKLLIIHTFGMGDSIMLLPVLRKLKSYYPKVTIDILNHQNIAAFPFKYSEDVSTIHHLEYTLTGITKSLLSMRKQKYDAVFVTPGGTPWKGALFAWCLNVKLRVGPSSFLSDFFFNRLSKVSYNSHRSVDSLSLLRTIYPKLSESYFLNPCFSLTEASKNKADKFIGSNKLSSYITLGVHPGCNAKNKHRRWPKEYFVEILNMIKDLNTNLKILIFSGPDEIEEATYINNKIDSILIKDKSLEDISALIAKCDIFFNTDSGLGHIASCFIEKTITIFGPANHMKTKPLSRSAVVLHKDLPCYPCISTQKKSCQYECLKKLTPLEVWGKIKPTISNWLNELEEKRC